MPAPGDPVASHFAARAADYRRRSESGLWRLQRHRETAAVFALLGDVSGRTALDLGCGTGHYARALAARGARDVVALDRSAEMLAGLSDEPRITPLAGDATSFKLSRRFDRIVCAGVIEFVPDPLAVLASARAHAVPGCTMALLTAYRGVGGVLYRLYHASHDVAVNLSSPASLQRLAVAAGWRLGRCDLVRPFTMVAQLLAEP